MKLSSPLMNGHAVRETPVVVPPRRAQGGVAAISRVDVAFLNLFSAVTGLSQGEALWRVYKTRSGQFLQRCRTAV
ncbi:MAG TPA: hypothetical protein VMN36_10405 [Verrucomicrobiales bacterium]|nr:hypothetical protein [Verrucomicrobiales bacterium]